MDLIAARKKSGLTQDDCAQLLDISESKISRIEAGETLPNLRDLCTLSLVYGRTLENLAQGMFEGIARVLPERLEGLPADKKGWLPAFNRNNTLNKLQARLRAINKLDHGSA